MSLHDRSILIDLTLRGLGRSKTDRAATHRIKSEGDHDKEGRWVTQLWPKEALDPIAAHDRTVRAYHTEQTLPWLDNSKRILPTASFPDYMNSMRDFRLERETLVRDFLNRYDHWIDQARASRKGDFKDTDYPSLRKATARFDFKVEAEPVPHRDDFRITLAGPDMSEMQDILDERIAAAERLVRNDLITRITTPLAHMVERLSEPGATFKDSLFGNVRAIADLIPELNVTEDPEIEAVRVKIMNKLHQLDPASVRESDFMRNQTAKAASDILSTMAPWLEDSTSEQAA